MRLTEVISVAATAWVFVQPVRAASSPELVDLVGRIEYGFYTEESRVIDAAAAALDRLEDSDEVRYYRDFASLRLAQLAEPRVAASLTRRCAARSVPDGLDAVAAAEAWILVAACGVAGDASARRVEEALARAHGLDRDNPRAALVEAWMMRRAAGSETWASPEVLEQLEAAVAGFDSWAAPRGAPDWGQAEALAALGEAALLRGEARTARDLVERALLLAPEYGYAVRLRGLILGNRGGEATP